MLPWQPFFGFLYIGATWRMRLNVSMCCGDAALCQITWPLVLFELMPFCCVLLQSSRDAKYCDVFMSVCLFTRMSVWPSPGLVHYIHIFGALAPWRNFARCRIHFTSKSCVLLYWQRYCTALQQRASAKLRHGTRNGITKLLQRVPPILGWAAITFGIGPHSSCKYIPT